MYIVTWFGDDGQQREAIFFKRENAEREAAFLKSVGMFKVRLTEKE